MIATCIDQHTRGLSEACLSAEAGFTSDLVLPLTPGRQYPVFGLTFRQGVTWYYVIDDNALWHPTWYPEPLFELTDPAVRPEWVYRHHVDATLGIDYPIIAFPEWANDLYFYDRLTDRDPGAVATFDHYRVKWAGGLT